jgi:hypothetical protein
MLGGNYIAKKMHYIGTAIKGAIENPIILDKLSPYGYTSVVLNEGQKMWNDVDYLIAVQLKEYGKQYLATDEQDKFIESTYGQYMVTVKVSRVAFVENPDILASLGLVGERPRSLSGWLRSAKNLYTNLLEIPVALQIIHEYGYTPERIDRELQDVKKVEELHVKQLSEKSAAQIATQNRDKAFDELCKWFSKFRAIARVALYDEPQLLEALGIVKK